jgi:hypothetical protein
VRDQALGGDLGHCLVGLVHPLTALVAQGKGQAVGDLLRGGGAQGRVVRGKFLKSRDSARNFGVCGATLNFAEIAAQFQRLAKMGTAAFRRVAPQTGSFLCFSRNFSALPLRTVQLQFGIAPALHEDIKYVAILIDGAPEIVQFAATADEHLVHEPLITRSWPAPLQRIDEQTAEADAPVAAAFVADHHTTRSQDQLDIAQAQAEAMIQPDGVLDWMISTGKRKPR